jgi:hypothetical protein
MAWWCRTCEDLTCGVKVWPEVWSDSGLRACNYWNGVGWAGLRWDSLDSLDRTAAYLCSTTEHFLASFQRPKIRTIQALD